MYDLRLIVIWNTIQSLSTCKEHTLDFEIARAATLLVSLLYIFHEEIAYCKFTKTRLNTLDNILNKIATLINIEQSIHKHYSDISSRRLVASSKDNQKKTHDKQQVRIKEVGNEMKIYTFQHWQEEDEDD